MQHFSKNNRALLDFDFPRPDRRSPHLRPIWTVLRMVGIRINGPVCMERTRHGWHVIVPLSEQLEPGEIVALQLAMGDDDRRGALNLMRAIAIRKKCDGVTPFWARRWNILYSGKLA